MKPKMLLFILILGAIATFSLFGTAGAANTGTVSPSVTVGTTLSLTLEDTTYVQWGPQSAGSNPTGTIKARIGVNTNWTLTVQADHNLQHTDGNHWLGANSATGSCSVFKYTSAAGSPAPPNANGITNAIPFDANNQTDVWTGGTATNECRVAITYDLQIPASQYPGSYSATHTYTLTSL